MRTFLVLAFVFLVAAPGVRAEEPVAKGLVLEVRIPERVESGTPLALESAFVNRGKSRIEFFAPEFADRNKFPDFVFTDSTGTRWKPYDAPFQSMWEIGLHGEVITLAPGAERVFDYEVAEFVRIQDPNSQRWNSPVSLPAGTYSVSASYAKADDRLPYGVDGGPTSPFASEQRPHPGLWTGELQAKARTLEVSPPRTMTVTIDSPYELTPGEPFPLSVTLRNGGNTPFRFDGSIRVSGASKAYGGGTATVPVPDTDGPLTLAAGEIRTFEVDLAALTFQPTWIRRNRAPGPLTTILSGRGIFVLTAEIGTREQELHVASNELWRMRTGASR